MGTAQPEIGGRDRVRSPHQRTISPRHKIHPLAPRQSPDSMHLRAGRPGRWSCLEVAKRSRLIILRQASPEQLAFPIENLHYPRVARTALRGNCFSELMRLQTLTFHGLLLGAASA